jgi:hypothetical protein
MDSLSIWSSRKKREVVIPILPVMNHKSIKKLKMTDMMRLALTEGDSSDAFVLSVIQRINKGSKSQERSEERAFYSIQRVAHSCLSLARVSHRNGGGKYYTIIRRDCH